MGFIITDRNIVYWRWYTVSGMLHLFMHLILMANFKEGMWRDYFSIPLIIILRE
jgi:hypothetical protein